MFHKLFDLNRDGKLDAAEKAVEYMVFRSVIGEEEDDEEDMESPYSYTLSFEYDPLIFWKTVFILDRHYSSWKQTFFEDPLDGTLLKKYTSSNGVIEVHCDWEIGAVFVDATIPLNAIL